VRTSYSILTQTQTVQYSLLHTYAVWYSLLLLCYKPVQHVSVLNAVGNCNTVVSNLILNYNNMGPPSYIRSVIDRNVVMRRVLYRASQCSVFTECVWCACTNVQDSKWHRVLVPLCLHRSSQYINSRALTDCTDCVTVWMVLTVRGLRCEVRQCWDIMWIVERSLCGILERGYVEVRINILQEAEILTVCQSVKLFTSIGKIKQTTNCI